MTLIKSSDQLCVARVKLLHFVLVCRTFLKIMTSFNDNMIFQLKELNLTCLKVPDSNKTGHCAPSLWPAASILSSDHLQSKTFLLLKEI